MIHVAVCLFLGWLNIYFLFSVCLNYLVLANGIDGVCVAGQCVLHKAHNVCVLLLHVCVCQHMVLLQCVCVSGPRVFVNMVLLQCVCVAGPRVCVGPHGRVSWTQCHL